MGSKLSTANPYLRDPTVRKQGLWISAKTSSAVEGIEEPFAKQDVTTAARKPLANGGRASRNGPKSGGSRR